MIGTLYGKLVAALLGLIVLIGLLYVGLTLMTTRLYLQEVNQTLNRSLAAGIVGETWLMRDARINETALKDVFHQLMVINPGIEVYLLDGDGKILAFSAAPDKVKRKRISLAPVRAYLDGNEDLPIRGDDPRGLDREKVFSVAPIETDGRLEGYLYVVLGGEAYDSVAEMFQRSYIFRLSAGVIAAGLLLTLAVGLIAFNLLTRRMRRLTQVMETFKQSDFQQPVNLAGWRRGGGDEIDRLGVTFEAMSRRINDQIEELTHADASRREMVANISHDLRTPMASLQGYLETLQIKEDSLSPEERRHYLDLAVKHGERLARLIAELFELAMLETGDAKLNLEPFSIGELVQDVCQKFRLEAETKKLRLEADIPTDAAFVAGDIGLIERVLENLIENAIKYTPEGGDIRLSLVAGPGRITARIADSGRGIAKEDLPHIFERFYRAGERHRGEPEGTGLGLAIAQRILQLHGSPIEVDSALGRGTTFSFYLPVAAA